jgi:aryl-alcohol dehydrogenase-like predicted oxidoreductase
VSNEQAATTRRGFVQSTLAAGFAASQVASAQSSTPRPAVAAGEWRNKQSTMSYRRLGRTGMMISEIVSGGDPIRSENWKHLNLALEMGLNYLDMAPAYGNGDCELAYGKLLAQSPVKRDNLFLTTKISAFGRLRNQLYKEIFDGLPGDKQSAIQKRADEMRAASLAEKPGYFIQYYPGQKNQFAPTYLSNAMMKDYAHRVEGSQKFREAIQQSIDDSLKRVGTDHFDIVMCPHGACVTEELDNPHIYETFQAIRKAGKARFLGVTSHNDPAAIVRKATSLGHYEVIMMAYNVCNGGYLDQAIADAGAKGIGLIAMKAAHAVASHHKAVLPIPQWRIEKIHRVIPGDMKAPMKAYLWALQNPHISAVISNLWDETYVRENLSLAGKKVELQPA